MRSTVLLTASSDAASQNSGCRHPTEPGVAAAVRAEGPSDAAVALWTRALEIDPLHRMARVNLALDLHRRGRFDAATVHWDELLRRHPADPEVLYNAGVTRAHRGEVPVAADLYQACLERAPDHVEARINLAALYHKHGTPRDDLGLHRYLHDDAVSARPSSASAPARASRQAKLACPSLRWIRSTRRPRTSRSRRAPTPRTISCWIRQL